MAVFMPESSVFSCPLSLKSALIGCLDDLRCLKIGAHTWVKRRDDWLQLPEDVPQFEEGYDRKGTWPASNLDRLAKSVEGAT